MKDWNLFGKNLAELTSVAVDYGEKPFRGKQLYHLLYRKQERDVQRMTELPSAFRDRLLEHYHLQLPETSRESRSLDGTTKILFRLQDGEHIETVVIPEPDRTTLCISSQVGCDVGCTFCLTAQMGFRRNLKPGEILGQIVAAIAGGHVEPQGFNVVFMGMGEPLYNYRHVMSAFRIMVDPQGLGLSRRRVTISTSGVVPVLEKMRDEPILPNLAISLNAATDELRSQLMPLNERWPLQQLLDSCRRFPLEPRRRITFEYVLLRGVTDSPQQARQLSTLLRGISSKVNLIPYNPNPGLPYQRPSARTIEDFRDILVRNHVSAFVRRARGDDISAACGQLAFLQEKRAHG